MKNYVEFYYSPFLWVGFRLILCQKQLNYKYGNQGCFCINVVNLILNVEQDLQGIISVLCIDPGSIQRGMWLPSNNHCSGVT